MSSSFQVSVRDLGYHVTFASGNELTNGRHPPLLVSLPSAYFPPFLYPAPSSVLMPAAPKKATTKIVSKANGPPSKSHAAAHPTWVDMIKECIVAHPEDARAGVSRPMIKKFVESKYHIDLTTTAASQLNRAITSGSEKGIFQLPKGPSGKVKLAPKARPDAAKENAKPPAKKPAAAKPATTKAKPAAVATKKPTAAKPKPATVKASPATKKYTAVAKKAPTKKATSTTKKTPIAKKPPTTTKKVTTKPGATKKALIGEIKKPAAKAKPGNKAKPASKAKPTSKAKPASKTKPASKSKAAKPASKTKPSSKTVAA